MAYVPNLIPERSKVLPDYFMGERYAITRKNSHNDALMWTLGIPCFLAALGSIAHPLLLLLLGLTGFVLIPPGHKLLEHKLRFRLTNRIKAIACGMLFILALPLGIHYADADKQLALQEQLLQEQTEKEKAITIQKEQQRKDSLAYHVALSKQLGHRHKTQEAAGELRRALAFAGTPSDHDLLAKATTDIATIRTTDLVKAGNYKEALAEIDGLLTADPSNTDLLYSRAVCYSKTGNIQDAVKDLMPLLKAGNREAKKLHDKINPVRKKIVGYETLCCDGSMSSARGRGACSHHGGVCDWNHPIYEEYRKYE